MDKFEIIKNFLLDESVSPEIRRERFDIAWDIRNYLNEIEKVLRRKIFETVVKKLKNIGNFKNYKKLDKDFLKGKRYGSFLLYKDEWTISENPIVSYAMEFEKEDFRAIALGIVKQNEKFPFNGKWISAKLPKDLEDILLTLQKILNSWNVSEWWIFWKHFDGFYALRNQQEEYEFYIRLISSNTLQEGINSLADYYVRKMIELRELTERYLDEFVELVKKHQMESSF